MQKTNITPSTQIPSGFDASRLKGGVPNTYKYANSVPSNWTIKVHPEPEKEKDGVVLAVNSITQDSFEGTPKEFSQYLRELGSLPVTHTDTQFKLPV